MSFPIIPGSVGGKTATFRVEFVGGIWVAFSAACSGSAPGFWEAQRMRTFIAALLLAAQVSAAQVSLARAPAGISIASTHALQNWSSNGPGYQVWDRGCCEAPVSSNIAREE